MDYITTSGSVYIRTGRVMRYIGHPNIGNALK